MNAQLIRWGMLACTLIIFLTILILLPMRMVNDSEFIILVFGSCLIVDHLSKKLKDIAQKKD